MRRLVRCAALLALALGGLLNCGGAIMPETTQSGLRHTPAAPRFHALIFSKTSE
jgi:hypothetical protein